MSAKLTKAQILEILSVTAVVISLLFVAYEIRQSNQIALVAAVNEIYGSFTDINEAHMGDLELTELLSRSDTAENLFI